MMKRGSVSAPRRVAPLALPFPGKFSDTHMRLPESLPFLRWLEIGALLGRLGRSTPWWVGEWLNFGEAKYGEWYSQGEAVTGLDPGTLSNIVAVCSRISPSRRRAALPFALHAAVAYLEPPEQDKWLDRAEKGHWTRQQLREALGKGRKAIGSGGDGTDPSAGCARCLRLEEALRGVLLALPPRPRPGEASAMLAAGAPVFDAADEARRLMETESI